MIIVHPVDEVLEVSLGKDVSFWISAMHYKHRRKMNAMVYGRSGGVEEENTLDTAFYSVKYCLKKTKGLTLPDGSEYELRFETDCGLKVLTDECVEELLTTELQTSLILVASNFFNSLPEKLQLPDGEPIPGVEIVRPKTQVKKKSKSQTQS